MYTEVELLGRKRVPNGRQLDTFADALASLEYYLEALRENRLNRENILEIARGSLESLGYWPLPDVQPAQEESIAEPDAQAEQALADDVDHNVRSDEHTSELQSLLRISYAVFCLKKKK